MAKPGQTATGDIEMIRVIILFIIFVFMAQSFATYLGIQKERQSWCDEITSSNYNICMKYGSNFIDHIDPEVAEY